MRRTPSFYYHFRIEPEYECLQGSFRFSFPSGVPSDNVMNWNLYQNTIVCRPRLLFTVER